MIPYHHIHYPNFSMVRRAKPANKAKGVHKAKSVAKAKSVHKAKSVSKAKIADYDNIDASARPRTGTTSCQRSIMTLFKTVSLLL